MEEIDQNLQPIAAESRTILIVEDEITLSNILKDALEKIGATVVTAMNGKQGLDKALEIKPDLILMDIVMPVMDGISMLNELRKDDWGKNAKIIVLTNLNYIKGLEPYVHFPSLKPTKDGRLEDYLVKTSWEIKDILKKINDSLDETEEEVFGKSL